MKLESRINKLEHRASLSEDDIATRIRRGVDAIRSGEPLPETPMEYLEEMARKHPKSMWPRMLEGRRRIEGAREKLEMLKMPLRELEKQARKQPDSLWAQMYEARLRMGTPEEKS